jgi:hypothetical protein
MDATLVACRTLAPVVLRTIPGGVSFPARVL